jgi:hypothetical protein
MTAVCKEFEASMIIKNATVKKWTSSTHLNQSYEDK